MTAEEIKKQVSAKYGIAVKDICGPVRTKHIVHARHVAMYLARKHTELSLPQIGRAFGGRNHTSVMHACRKMEAMIGRDARLASSLSAMQAAVSHT